MLLTSSTVRPPVGVVEDVDAGEIGADRRRGAHGELRHRRIGHGGYAAGRRA